MKKNRKISPGQLCLDVDSAIAAVRNRAIRERLKALPPTHYIPTISRAAEFQACPTPYNGINHRSRTEARYAVLFDLLGLHYVYEMEKIDLRRGASIPDFYLPHYDVWVEVGPDVMEIHEGKLEKAQRLADVTGRAVLITKGFPRTTAHYPFEGCTLTLPSQFTVSAETVRRHFPGLAGLREWTGPDVNDAIGVAGNFQFEAIRDHSRGA